MTTKCIPERARPSRLRGLRNPDAAIYAALAAAHACHVCHLGALFGWAAVALYVALAYRHVLHRA